MSGYDLTGITPFDLAGVGGGGGGGEGGVTIGQVNAAIATAIAGKANIGDVHDEIDDAITAEHSAWSNALAEKADSTAMFAAIGSAVGDLSDSFDIAMLTVVTSDDYDIVDQVTQAEFDALDPAIDRTLYVVVG